MSIETMTKLATTTLGTSTASVTFSNIPQTYTDLVLKISSRTDRSLQNDEINVRINGDTSSVYTYRSISGDGTSLTNSTETNTTRFRNVNNTPGATATSNTFGSTEMYIPNYTSSNYKSISFDATGENNATLSYIGFAAGIWSNTSAVTSFELFPRIGPNFVQHSTFTLYGVKAMRTAVGSNGWTSGGARTFDGTYFYHTFTSSGTFVPHKDMQVDYLVVAGGGAGGYIDADGHVSGGGGAGGLRCTVGATGGGGALESTLSLTAGTVYPVAVGAGGSGGSTSATPSNGSNSVFYNIISFGGGRGRGDAAVGNQGSGGGGSSSTTAGGTATSGQGYNGGTGFQSGNFFVGGGGGGASAVGANGSGTSGSSSGGNGVATSISGSSVTYAGGGGGAGRNATGANFLGGAGGAGGGGAGGGESERGDGDSGNAGLVRAGRNATANTGGGGGGNHSFAGETSGAGGSGIVIIRYKG